MSRALLLLLCALLVAASTVTAQTIVARYGASPFTAIDVDVTTGSTFAISGSSIVSSDLNGNFLSAFTLPSSLSASPAAIAISRATSILYLTDSITPQRIITLSTNGTLLNVFPLAINNTNFTYSPNALALDGSDNVYLIALQSRQFASNATVVKFTATGSGLSFASLLNCTTVGTNVTSASLAVSVAVNSNGSSVVVGMSGGVRNQVVQYSAANSSVQWSFGVFGSSPQQPVAVNKTTGDVYFTTRGNSIVIRCNSSGYTNSSYPLARPMVAIALDDPRSLLYALVPNSLYIARWMTGNPGSAPVPYLPASNSYVAISAPVAVASVPFENSTVAVAGGSGVALLSHNSPPAVLSTAALLSSGQFAVDINGDYYFPGSSSISELTGQFVPVQQFSVSRQPGLSSPQAVAVDSQYRVWVADTSNNRIAQFTANGYPQLMVTGSNPQLYAPQALQLYNGSLYALDANGRLLQFALSNGQQTAVIIDTGGALFNPVSLAIDSAGCFYIADAYMQRVTQHSSTGQLLAVLTDENSPIANPRSVAVDSVNSLLYIVDQTGAPNNFVYVIQIPPLCPSPPREQHQQAMMA